MHRSYDSRYDAYHRLDEVTVSSPRVRWLPSLRFDLQIQVLVVIPNYDAQPNSAPETCRLLAQNEMSQYRAYFVPGATDPNGLKVVIADEKRRKVFAKIFNQLCPEGKFEVLSDGSLYSTTFGFCNTETGTDENGTCHTLGPTHPTTDHPKSCGCVCTAINSDRVFTMVWEPKRRKGFLSVVRDAIDPPNWGSATREENPTITVGPRLDLPGVTPSLQIDEVRGDRWSTLAHELCGHGITGLAPPNRG